MNIMKIMRQNKTTVIVILLFIILVFAGLAVKDWFFPDDGKALYGDIEGLSEHEFTNEMQTALITKFKENTSVKEVEIIVKEAKLITVILTVNDDVTVDTAKALPNIILENVEEKYLSFYDFQVMIKKDVEDATFPIIGTKHNSLAIFSY